MADFGTFIWAVINNWAGYLTGGLLVGFFGLWFQWRDRPLPRYIALAIAAVALLLAFYKAWHDQFSENRVAH